MSYNRPMFELEPLIAALRAANVEDLARRSGISSKTIYRIRQRASHLPNIGTVMRLRRALEEAANATGHGPDGANEEARDAA